jgi:hypothetical protein
MCQVAAARRTNSLGERGRWLTIVVHWRLAVGAKPTFEDTVDPLLAEGTGQANELGHGKILEHGSV